MGNYSLFILKLLFLVEESDQEHEKISIIYTKLNNFYNEFENIEYINGNILACHQFTYE